MRASTLKAQSIGVSRAAVERLLADEPEALARLREELTAEQGAPKGNDNASKTKTNNVSCCLDEPDLFATPPAKPKRERQTEHGNRKDYTLVRPAIPQARILFMAPDACFHAAGNRVRPNRQGRPHSSSRPTNG